MQVSNGVKTPIAHALKRLLKPKKSFANRKRSVSYYFWWEKVLLNICMGKFLLVTGHKPLASIFSPNKPIASFNSAEVATLRYCTNGISIWHQV